MGLVLFILLSVLEIILAVKGRGKEKEKKVWLKNRLVVRLAEAVIVLVALLLPFGQKWRLVPLLGFLAVLGIIALLKWLGGRRKGNVEKKAGSAVSNCVFSILFIGLLLIPALVFTGYKGLPVSGPHPVAESSAIVIDSSRTDPYEQDGSFRDVPVHFYYPADAAEGEQFPLVVFSHGAFGYYESNTSTYMELASNGYVVAALDHPHHAFFTQDSSGNTVIVDQDFFQTAATLSSSNSYDNPEECYPVYRKWTDLRTADMNCVLDELKAAGESGKLNDAWFLPENNADTILSVVKNTDTTKIGLMGHSMGGATSVQVGRERDDISAVIDLDGTMLGEYLGVENGNYVVNEEPYTVPLLEFANWEQYNDRKEYPSLGYLDYTGQVRYVYSWRLDKNDRTPDGRKNDIPLREKERKIQADLFDQIVSNGGNYSVLELVERYISTKTGVRNSTRAGYKTVTNFLEKDPMGSRRIDKVKLSDAKIWLIKLQQEQGKSYSAIHTIRGVLRPAFRMAVDDDLIRKNPFDFELATVIVNDSVTREAITRDQERRFLAFIKGDKHFCRYYDGIYILLHTGLRISEFCGLTMASVDFKGHKIIVDHQLLRTSQMEYVIEDTKTESGARMVPMTPEVEACFRKILDARAKPKIEPIIDGHSGFLFLDKNGMPMVALHWEKYFQHIVEKYNKIYKVQLPKITPHVCRHTFCSKMAKNGMNPKTLQYIMGHSDISVTLNTYTHVSFEDAQAEVKRMSAG